MEVCNEELVYVPLVHEVVQDGAHSCDVGIDGLVRQLLLGQVRLVLQHQPLVRHGDGVVQTKEEGKVVRRVLVILDGGW